MPRPASTSDRLANVIIAVSLLIGLACVAVVWVTTGEAHEERRSATAAADLRLAAITVDSSEELLEAGAFDDGRLRAALVVLAGDNEVALHALDESDRAEAEQLLTDLINCGVDLLEQSDTGGTHPIHDYDGLQELLGRASESASADASAAETVAQRALLAAIAVGAVVAFLLLQSRGRVARERAAASALIESGRRTAALLNDSPDVILVVAPDGVVTYRSASAERVFGEGLPRRIDDLVACTAANDPETLRAHVLRHDAACATAVFEMTTIDGDVRSFECRVSDLDDDELVRGHLLTARDVTSELALRAELETQARTDELTGLPNRRALEPAVAAVPDTSRAVGLLILDLDGFKVTNDTYGHEAGDGLLVRVARRLGDVLADDETLVRLGGDEFAVILPAADGTVLVAAGERFLGALLEPFAIGDHRESLRASIGAARSLGRAEPSTLMRQADIALYEAKRSGGDTVAVFEPIMENRAAEASAVSRALRDADYDAEFRLVYQPVVEARSGSVVGLEALLRWTSPELGTVAPVRFIPIAEETGVIADIGAWVLDRVCAQLADWDADGFGRELSVSVNVSPRQLGRPRFVESVLAAAQQHGVAHGRLVLEVTESAMVVQGDRSVERLERLRALGFRVAVDDFGTGYSNLCQLLDLPLDIIKIDRSLLETLARKRTEVGGRLDEPCEIIKAVVAIAGALQVDVVAEGVEFDHQRRSLHDSGVTHLQGFLFGHPATPDEVRAVLEMDGDRLSAVR